MKRVRRGLSSLLIPALAFSPCLSHAASAQRSSVSQGLSFKAAIPTQTLFMPPRFEVKAQEVGSFLENMAASAQAPDEVQGRLGQSLETVLVGGQQIPDTGTVMPAGIAPWGPSFGFGLGRAGDGRGGGDRFSPPRLGREGGTSPEGEGPGSRLQDRLKRAWDWLRWEVSPGWKIGVSAALAAAITIGALYHNSQKWNEFWSGSKSKSDVVLLEEARHKGDAGALEALAREALARQGRMQKRIEAAKTAASSTVDDPSHDTVKEAETYSAYDGLVWARATLNHNFVSQDPAKRLGEELPSSWVSRVNALEVRARESGFEGRLALELEWLGAELGREQGKSQALEVQIDLYGKRVPTLFGGQLSQEHQKGRRDLGEFREREISPEQGLLAAKTAAMRGRLDSRLYGESVEYRAHRDRRDRLASLYASKVGPAVALAEQIDSDLRSMISNRETEAAMMALAAANTNVPVEKCDTEYDSDGNSHTSCHIEYEDHSGPYRIAAAAAAMAAASDARSANEGLQRLKPMVEGLYGDETLKAEGLTGSLPRGEGRRVGEGDLHVVVDAFFSPMFGIFGGLSSASDGALARRSFAPALSSLQTVGGEVSGRRDAEGRWVEGKITADLQRQLAEAKSYLGPERR